jgi:hypothetical protein
LFYQLSFADGYELTESRLPSGPRQLKEHQYRKLFDWLIIGNINNSDDNVPLVLSSFGLHISLMRHMDDCNVSDKPYRPAGLQMYDVESNCLSCNVCIEKLRVDIFLAARHLGRRIIAGQNQGP